MTRKEAVERIKASYPMGPMLQKAKAGNYVCPVCGSGAHVYKDHKKSDGALAYYPKTNTACCFGGCDPGTNKGRKYDVLDIFQAVNQCDYNTALAVMARELGLDIDGKEETVSDRPAPSLPAKEDPHPDEGPRADFTAYYQACMDRLTDSRAMTYLSSRGISLENARAHYLGFDPVADTSNHPGDMSGTKYHYSEPRIIIPTSKEHYTGRAINPVAGLPKANPKGMRISLFNSNFLRSGADIVFVTEGAFDALSVLEAGEEAIGLNGAGNVGVLLSAVEERKLDMVFIIALDEDGTGARAADTLRKGLVKLGMTYIDADICLGHKDPNEALTADREGFFRAVKDAADRARKAKGQGETFSFDTVFENGKPVASPSLPAEEPRTEPQPQTEPPAEPGVSAVDAFLAEVQTERFRPLPTGIKGVDAALDGGFTRKTLVLLGAAPGMGKTVFCQWILENMAMSGSDVLYINLEMDRAQLLARSISRMAWIEKNADLSSLSVLRGYKWTEEQKSIVVDAARIYQERIAPRFMYNPSGISNKIWKLEEVMREHVEKVKAQGREAPIICLDYLQLVDPGERDAIEGMKNVIKRLKDFAMQYNTVILAIMANNRASNKSGSADMESGRDTSAIEYSGDVMLGLVYTAIEDKEPVEETFGFDSVIDAKSTKKQEVYTIDVIRALKKAAHDAGRPVPEVCNRISLKVNKNRFGESEKRVKLVFDGKHSIFREESAVPGSSGWEAVPEGKSVFD